MHGSPSLGPLALLGYSLLLVALSYLAVRHFKLGGRLLGWLPVATLPAPAISSASSLAASLSRKLKAAKSAAVKNAGLRDTPRWSSLMASLKGRWQNRPFLEQLPTTASSEISLDPKTEPPVLVDLTETSAISTPSIPLRVLGATFPSLRSPTPLLAPPPLTAASASSAFPVDSPAPPQRGLGHRFEPVSPSSSPPSNSSKSSGRTLIYPHSRPRTPSPISQNPYFLSTSPEPVHHRRTRSLGGVNVKRVALPMLNSGDGKFVPGSFGAHLMELKNVGSSRGITSRSTELLVDLESGEECGVPLLVDLRGGLLYDGKPLNRLDALQVEATGEGAEKEMERVDAGPQVMFPKVVTNNAWRHWDELVATDPKVLMYSSPDLSTPLGNAAQPEPSALVFTPSQDPLTEPLPVWDLFDNSLNENFEGHSAPSFPVNTVLDTDVTFLPALAAEFKVPPENISPSQMPTPPASPHISLRRMPSVSGFEEIDAEADIGEAAVGDSVVECIPEQEDGNTLTRHSLLQEAVTDELDAEDPVTECVPEHENGSLPDDMSGGSNEELVTVVIPVQDVDLCVDDDPFMDELCGEGEGLADDVLEEQETDDGLTDDPPMPAIAAQDTIEITGVDEDLTAADPPVPTIPLCIERIRPAWSIRAAESSRLGIVERPSSSTPEGDDSVPGAFPDMSFAVPPAAEQSRVWATTAKSPPIRHSSIDTSSLAAAILSLRRKPEPLDIALAMQMRPGLGAGADPAWMVRFMMAVFGWVAVAVSAGID